MTRVDFMDDQRDYYEHFTQQKGKCAECGKPHNRYRRQNVLRAQCDSETRKIRRLLCSDCLEVER